jgi:hypothetical protein
MNHNYLTRFGVKIMGHKIQITVDDNLNKTLKARAKEMGLSFSSYARLALMSVVPAKNGKLLEQAMFDIRTNNIGNLTLDEFNSQLDNL